MPNIRQYDAPAGLGLQPTEVGIDANVQAARRIGTFYNQKADALGQEGQVAASSLRDAGDAAVAFEDHREISAGAATGTALMAKTLTDWNATVKNADPNDPSVAQKFLTEQLEPSLEKWTSGFNTERSQQFAEQFADQLRRDMFHKTAADLSTMAGIAVQQNARTTVNSLGTAVSADPSSLDFALNTVDHTLGHTVDSSPTLSPEDAARVKASVTQEAKESIVKAAVSSMIQKNPNVDLGAIEKKYGDYLKPGEIQQFQKAAQTQAKVDALTQKQADLYQRQQDKEAAEKAADKLITDHVKLDPNTGRPIIGPDFFSTALELAKMPNAPPGLARTFIDWGEKQQNERAAPVVDDAQAKQDLTERLFSADNPTTIPQLMKAATDGKINDHTFNTLKGLVNELQTTPLKGPIWQNTMAAVKDQLIVNVPGIPGKDAVGTANYANFMQNFVPQYLAKYRSGTLPPNALDARDPNSMISQAMAPFKRSQADRMRDYVAGTGGIGSTAPAAPQRNDVMPAIPPPDQRPAGLYSTPRGTMRWTGTGWVKP
jgi:hypothetical protein